MPHLCIKNIGPIKDLDIKLNKINVFLGPQSSGKSTIARIISFCQWLQKDVAVRQGVDHIDGAFVKANLFDYHNISSYFKP
ncbi:MAG: AAA family ATPase, partial [Muribaculaceae bacterium]|nr:AAA family ATPase [Muribaculaceae bacterium]